MAKLGSLPNASANRTWRTETKTLGWHQGQSWKGGRKAWKAFCRENAASTVYERKNSDEPDFVDQADAKWHVAEELTYWTPQDYPMATITSKFTKERLIDWAVISVAERVRDLKDAPESVKAAANLKLAEIALAALTAEPVAWKYRLVDIDSGTGDHWKYSTQCITPASGKTHRIESVPLYTVSQPVPEREQVRREHAKWSDKTFGDIGPVGPLKHLSKEAMEAAAEPDDLSEWADMQFLLWDAQRRAGITDEQITRVMKEKLAINKARQCR